MKFIDVDVMSTAYNDDRCCFVDTFVWRYECGYSGLFFNSFGVWSLLMQMMRWVEHTIDDIVIGSNVSNWHWYGHPCGVWLWVKSWKAPLKKECCVFNVVIYNNLVQEIFVQFVLFGARKRPLWCMKACFQCRAIVIFWSCITEMLIQKIALQYGKN